MADTNCIEIDVEAFSYPPELDLLSMRIDEVTEVASDLAIQTLRDNVSAEGDTLKKLYALVINTFKEVTVADITARNAYNAPIGSHVLVLDDGDTRWALYKAVTAGENATYIKLSDPDLLNAQMSAAAIKVAYESNDDTNALTDALLASLTAMGQEELVDVAFTGEVNLSKRSTIYATYTPTSNIAVTLNATKKKGGGAEIPMVANSFTPVFDSGVFTKLENSADHSNVAGKVNWYVFYYNGSKVVYANTVL